MIEISSVPPQKSSASFGNLWKMFEKMFGEVRQAYRTTLENLRKSSESGQKSSESRHKRRLYSKQNNTWTLGDMEFIFLCSHSISYSFPALTRSISM